MSDESIIPFSVDEPFRKRFHIPVEILFQQFENHLQIENNLRVFFSAKFGSGKTYFLNEFFEANKEKYIVIKLYPVSYSTASNRDIFELIKFDILFHILSHYSHTIERSPEIKELLKIQFFISEFINQKKASLLTDVFSIFNEVAVVDPVTKLGTTKILTVLSEAFKEYEKFKKDTFKDDILESNEYLNRVLTEHPEYSFEDPISRIINESIKTLQTETKNRKEVILLIDDMDRLDPDHLFRILNVFGNHFVESNVSKFYRNENKFGFDKIITVGEIKNIKSIFSHRYGASADFSGYFSKYYSKGIYDYSSILKFDSEFCGRFLPELKIDETDYLRNCDRHPKIDFVILTQKLNHAKDTILTSILCSILQNQKITIRELLSYVNAEVINVTIAPSDIDVIADLSLYFYYLVRYLELLFRGNLKVFDTISIDDVPFCLKQVNHNIESHSSIVCSAVLLASYRSSYEFQRNYLLGNVESQVVNLTYLVEGVNEKVWKINPTRINDNRNGMNQWSLYNHVSFPPANANLWDLIKSSFKSSN